MEKMIKDKKECNFSFNPILVGSKMLSEDLTTSGVTLGQLREAKKWSQELHKKIANWITRGKSHSLFLEHNLELTKVKLLPDMKTLNVHWSATGVIHVDKYIQQKLGYETAMEIRQHLQTEVPDLVPEIVFKADHMRERIRQLTDLTQSRTPSTQQQQQELDIFGQMKLSSGIETLKRVEPVAVNGGGTPWSLMEENFTVVRQTRDLDYDRIMREVLARTTPGRTESAQDSSTVRSAAESKHSVVDFDEIHRQTRAKVGHFETDLDNEEFRTTDFDVDEFVRSLFN